MSDFHSPEGGDDRDRYYNSGRIRLVGGYEEAYYGDGDYEFGSMPE